MRVSETARERELFRYFQPGARFQHISIDPNVPSNSAPKASSDFTLTALAQLGALRLGAKRGLIVLLSSTAEYVIAEAGQTLSLQDETRHDEDDSLWHGVGIMEPPNPIALRMLDLMINGTAESPPIPYAVIPDLKEDERFQDCPFVRQDNHRSFLASAPIISPHNFVLGCYVVIDDKPRKGLSEADIRFIKDMAATVMDHLDTARTQVKQLRSEGMVRALGLFINGKSSMREWWIGQDNQTTKRRRRTAGRQSRSDEADIEFGVQDNPDSFFVQGLDRIMHRETEDDENDDFAMSPGPITEINGIETGPAGTSRGSERSHDIESSHPPSRSTYTSVSDQPLNIDGPEAFAEAPTPTESRANVDRTGRMLQEALVSADTKLIMSKATNLMREALGLDGAIFYDANVGSFGGSVSRPGLDRSRSGSQNAQMEATSSSEEEVPNAAGSIPHVRFKGHFSSNSDHEKEQDENCHILGYSTRTRSSLNNHALPDGQYSIPMSLLRRLLKKYPQGKVFDFDSDGGVSSSDSEGYRLDNLAKAAITRGEISFKDHEIQKKKRKMSRAQEAAAITKAIPGVRSAVFYPLWDPIKDHWFAGGLIWSTSVTRCFCPTEDLLYMAAFGNSMTAELTKLSAILTAQMKTDFTSNISHELRSPLHGVLASVEFLQETSMTEMQTDMVNTIQTCGNTLLDTINHVLDYSKVNKKWKDGPKAKRASSKQGRGAVHNPIPEDEENISVLTEEVVESIYAGYGTSRASSQYLINTRKMSTAHAPLPDSSGHVTVILDIEDRVNWNFHIDAGAWRRIVMNLFNNAMKFTKSGYVHVSLRITDVAPARHGRPQSAVELTVMDSGKGIARDFLRDHLYTPFSQEDSLVPGTGLGLIIVKKIVRDLSGTLDVISDESSTGTTARVTIPLSPVAQLANVPLLIAPSFVEVKEKAKGLSACLLAFDAYPEIGVQAPGILTPNEEARILLKTSVATVMNNWLGMSIVTSPESNEPSADVYVVAECGLAYEEELKDKLRAIARWRSSSSRPTSVIVLSTSPLTRLNFENPAEEINVYCIFQPYGPYKIANTLHHALCGPGEELDGPQSQTYIVKGKPLDMPITDREVPWKVLKSSSRASSPIQQSDTAPAEDCLRALLVDDNVINLKLLTAYMKKLALSHSTATNGLEALNTYSEAAGEFDVIFMDITMPIMDGLQASREIRHFESTRPGTTAAVIIALTGAASISARQEAFASGIDLFLTKPVGMRKLKSILEDLKKTRDKEKGGFPSPESGANLADVKHKAKEGTAEAPKREAKFELESSTVGWEKPDPGHKNAESKEEKVDSEQEKAKSGQEPMKLEQVAMKSEQGQIRPEQDEGVSKEAEPTIESEKPGQASNQEVNSVPEESRAADDRIGSSLGQTRSQETPPEVTRAIDVPQEEKNSSDEKIIQEGDASEGKTSEEVASEENASEGKISEGKISKAKISEEKISEEKISTPHHTPHESVPRAEEKSRAEEKDDLTDDRVKEPEIPKDLHATVEDVNVDEEKSAT